MGLEPYRERLGCMLAVKGLEDNVLMPSPSPTLLTDAIFLGSNTAFHMASTWGDAITIFLTWRPHASQACILRRNLLAEPAWAHVAVLFEKFLRKSGHTHGVSERLSYVTLG